MWNYEKRLEYPVNITTPNAKIAQIILSQYGGPDGEIGASMRYLSQRFTASNRTAMAVLTDVGTEELAHLEMVATIVYQLTRNLSSEELEKAGFAPYYADHTVGIWPQSAGGYPFSASELQSTGDPVADLFEDLAAELKKQFTIVIVTHNMQQAVRISDRTAFFLLGEMVEFGATESLFSMPRDKRTEDYITGRFG